jgi:hypothetical protein
MHRPKDYRFRSLSEIVPIEYNTLSDPARLCMDDGIAIAKFSLLFFNDYNEILRFS